MKKKLKAIFSVTLLLGMIFATDVFAESVREVVRVNINQMWTARPEISRSTNYSYVTARAYAVYPTDGSEDDFENVQVVVRDGNVIISNVYVLNEEVGNENIDIHEGHLAVSEVTFAFRGNDPDYAAYADVYYDAK